MIFQLILSILVSSVVLKDVCGIINGQLAKQDDFKYQASVREYQRPVCGGAIITPLHVLTAEHCVHQHPAAAYTVHAGATWIGSSDAEVVGVKEIHHHPVYKPPFEPTEAQKNDGVLTHEENDIAVLTLERPLPLGGPIAIVSFEKGDESFTPACKVAGWGLTWPKGRPSIYLRSAEFTILSSEDCASRNAPHRATELCTMCDKKHSTLCDGDSGGPLVCGKKLVGIATSSFCNPERPVTYANVSSYLSFINTAISGDQKGTAEPAEVPKLS